MRRRHFLGAALVPLLGAAVPVQAFEKTEYSRALYEELLASGKPFLLDFSVTW